MKHKIVSFIFSFFKLIVLIGQLYHPKIDPFFYIVINQSRSQSNKENRVWCQVIKIFSSHDYAMISTRVLFFIL